MEERCRCVKSSYGTTLKCLEVSDENKQTIFKELCRMNWHKKNVDINTLVDIDKPLRSLNRKDTSESRISDYLRYH